MVQSRLAVTFAFRLGPTEYSSAISRHDLPSFGLGSPEREGAGNAGCTLHPRSRVQWVEGGAHEHTGSAEALRHSLRNGFTAYFVLSPVGPGSLSPSPVELLPPT